MLRISLEALGRYELRTALSTLGITAVIAMLPVGEGAHQDVLRQVEQLGLDNVIVRTRGFGGDGRAARPLCVLRPRLRRALLGYRDPVGEHVQGAVPRATRG